MSTLQRSEGRLRRRRLVGAAWLAVGILVAFLVALAIFASGHVTHTTVTHSYRVSCPLARPDCPATGSPAAPAAASAASRASGTAERHFIVDPGSGFAVPARP
jgi:hypothetical protein